MSNNFYVHFKKVTHYWKWTAWTQPVFSDSNTASDGSVISSDSIRPDSNDYGAMDGVKSGSGERNTWKSDNTNNCYWKVVFPYEIKITGLTHYNARNKDNLYRNVQGRFYADEAMSIPIGDAISTPVTSWYQTPIANIPSEGIITDTIYFRKTGGDPVSGIGELEITATTLVEGSAEDYDFIEYDLKPPAIFMRKIPHYWKYIPWSQPVLGANGTLGGNSFAVNAASKYGEPYYAFDNSSSTYWEGDRLNSVPQSLTFYNPIRLKVSTITITNGSTTSGAPLTGEIYGSNDNDSWAQICAYSNSNSTAGASWDIVVNSQIAYNYHKILVSTVSGTRAWQVIREIDIAATVLEEGTAEDYDFKEWDVQCKVVARRFKDYYKWAAWTQPVFSSNVAADGSIISAEHYNTAYPGYPYGAMDGVKSGTTDINIFSGSGSSGVTTGWWKVKFPYKIKITKLVHYDRHNVTYSSITGQYFADEAMTIPIGNSFTSNTSWGATTVFDNSESPIITDTIFFNKTAGHYSSGIGELEITAMKAELSTSDDYDFYEY